MVAPKDMLLFIIMIHTPFPQKHFKHFKVVRPAHRKAFGLCATHFWKKEQSRWGGFSTIFFFGCTSRPISRGRVRPNQTSRFGSYGFFRFSVFSSGRRMRLGFLCCLVSFWWVLFTPSLPKMHWRAGRTRCHLLCFCQVLLAAQTSVVPFSSFCWREGSLSSPFKVRVKWPWGSL